MAAFVLAPLVLAAVLAASGWAKRRAVASTESVLRLLRLPAALQRRWVAQALPWGELVLAGLVVLLPAGPGQQLAAAATLLLMLAYWVVVARAMTFDPRPSCGCFGEIGDQRITARTLARNTVLVALAVVYLGWALADESVLGTLTDGSQAPLWVAGAAVAALVTWFIVAGPPAEPHDHDLADLYAQAVARSRSHAPAASKADPEAEDDYVRTPIPAALLTDPEGRNHTLAELARARAQLLVFVNCYCGTTAAALRAWPGYRSRLPEIDVRLVFAGVAPRTVGDGTDVSDAWTDHGAVAAGHLGLSGSPAAILLGADGLVAGGPVSGNDEVDAFVEEIAEAFSGAVPG